MDVIMGYGSVAAGCFCGVIGHLLKKIVAERQKNPDFGARRFLAMYPYRTAMTLFYAIGGTAGLYFTDTATFYTAMVVGFASNSLSGASDR